MQIAARLVAGHFRRLPHAIETCPPLTNELSQELRAVYLAYHGLLPELPFPQIHLVFGAGNSGGTATSEVQAREPRVLSAGSSLVRRD